MASVRIIDPKAEDRRCRNLITALFTVGFLGISYLVYDYVEIMNRTALPLDVAGVDPIVTQWKNEGLIQSFDVGRSELLVAEDRWTKRRPEERIGIITRLARYCAEKKQTNEWTLKVVGSQSLAVLGELGQSGLTIN